VAQEIKLNVIVETFNLNLHLKTLQVSNIFGYFGFLGFLLHATAWRVTFFGFVFRQKRTKMSVLDFQKIKQVQSELYDLTHGAETILSITYMMCLLCIKCTEEYYFNMKVV
jgi:hypothetical protein